jgi:hypothetical protein
MEFQLKTLSQEAIPAALERAERYRLLNEPAQAESICLDILSVDSDNQKATVLLLLSISDQFAENLTGNLDRASALLSGLGDEYQQIYYQGILYERMARAYLRRTAPGSHFSAYDMFREAMRLYEQAERLRPPGNDEALLRWNTCARAIMAFHLEQQPFDDFRPMLE